MTSLYHERALSRNDTGLPGFQGLPLFDWHETRKATFPYPMGLTPGGRIVYERTNRPVETCNAIAALAGVGCMEVDHA